MNQKEVLVVGITLVLFAVVFTGCTEEKGEEYETISYTELCVDIEFVNSLFTLQSYTYGDTLYIKDEIIDVKYIEGTEQSLTLVMLDLKHSYFNSTNLPLAFLGDKRDEYTVGSTVIIPVHVKAYTIEGETLIWLEEWYTFAMSGFVMPP